MNEIAFETQQAWLDARRGKITGTKVKELYSKPTKTQELAKLIKSLPEDTSVEDIAIRAGTNKATVIKCINQINELGYEAVVAKEHKIAFYQLIADRLGLAPDDENPMERGHRLEPEAIELFSEKYGKKVDTALKMWVSDRNDSIVMSPDGTIGKTEAVEVKCLGSARHIQAVIENKIPDDYEYQVRQYFIANESLKKLYFVMYDPRLRIEPMKVFEITRKEVQDDVDRLISFQEEILAEVDGWVTKLSNF